MDQQELQQKIQQLEAAYLDYLKEVAKIREEQDAILGDYAKRLDAFKVEKLKQQI